MRHRRWNRESGKRNSVFVKEKSSWFNDRLHLLLLFQNIYLTRRPSVEPFPPSSDLQTNCSWLFHIPPARHKWGIPFIPRDIASGPFILFLDTTNLRLESKTNLVNCRNKKLVEARFAWLNRMTVQLVENLFVILKAVGLTRRLSFTPISKILFRD